MILNLKFNFESGVIDFLLCSDLKNFGPYSQISSNHCIKTSSESFCTDDELFSDLFSWIWTYFPWAPLLCPHVGKHSSKLFRFLRFNLSSITSFSFFLSVEISSLHSALLSILEISSSDSSLWMSYPTVARFILLFGPLI